MTNSEFLGVLEQAERFYDKKLDNDQKIIWYESLKYMSVTRFKYLVSEWYRRYDFLPSLAKAISLDKEIGYSQENKNKLKEVVDCEICQGRGFVLYYQVINNYKYRFCARCNCQNASEYMGLPSLEQVGLAEAELIARRKLQKEKAKNIDKEAVMRQIKGILK